MRRRLRPTPAPERQHPQPNNRHHGNAEPTDLPPVPPHSTDPSKLHMPAVHARSPTRIRGRRKTYTILWSTVNSAKKTT